MNNFKRIKLGLGFTDDRLKNDPPKDKHVFKAMIRNYAYDIQSEGDRSLYAERLFNNSPHKTLLARKFTAYLSHMSDNLYCGHKNHAVRLAIRLVAHGIIETEDIIDIITDHYDLEDDSVNIDLLLKLGRSGTIKYLDIQGEAHAKRKWSEYYPSEESNTSLLQQITKLDIQATDISANASVFIEDIRHWKHDDSDHSPRFESFEQYMEYIQKERFYGRATKFFHSLTLRQRKMVEDRLSVAKADNEIIGLLSVIVENGLAGSYQHILPMIFSEDRVIRKKASSVLSKVRSDLVRKEAIALIKSKKRLQDGILLLGVNAAPQDDDLILTRLSNIKNKHVLHQCGYSLMATENVSQMVYLKNSFGHVYYNSRCGVCRATILDKYLPPQDLPLEQLGALKYDSYYRVRELSVSPLDS